MRWTCSLAAATALFGFSSAAPAAAAAAVGAVYNDPDTGFRFSDYNIDYKIGKSISVRIAVPSPAPSGAYDAVIQLVVPKEMGWAGIAWGGGMVQNPLAVAWPNGNSAVVSARWATTRSTPQIYNNAQFKLMSKGTKSNGTHWQYTAKCTGCTQWQGSSNVRLNPNGKNRFAFVYSTTKPSSTQPNGAISGHEHAVYWEHDFAAGANSGWDQLLARNP